MMPNRNPGDLLMQESNNEPPRFIGISDFKMLEVVSTVATAFTDRPRILGGLLGVLARQEIHTQLSGYSRSPQFLRILLTKIRYQTNLL